jgi:hypothetical protein
VDVRVDWEGPVGEWAWPDVAELLAIGDSGVYLLHGSQPVLYPFRSSATLRTRSRPIRRLDLRSRDDDDVEALTPYARYPFGMDDRVLEALIVALQVDSLVVRRRP